MLTHAVPSPQLPKLRDPGFEWWLETVEFMNHAFYVLSLRKNITDILLTFSLNTLRPLSGWASSGGFSHTILCYRLSHLSLSRTSLFENTKSFLSLSSSLTFHLCQQKLTYKREFKQEQKHIHRAGSGKTLSSVKVSLSCFVWSSIQFCLCVCHQESLGYSIPN